jgi:hypothetical protein
MLKAYTDRTASRFIEWCIPNTDYLRNLANELDHQAGLLEPRSGEYVSKEIAQSILVKCPIERKTVLTKLGESEVAEEVSV